MAAVILGMIGVALADHWVVHQVVQDPLARNEQVAPLHVLPTWRVERPSLRRSVLPTSLVTSTWCRRSALPISVKLLQQRVMKKGRS
jgi:hypothetical protein